MVPKILIKKKWGSKPESKRVSEVNVGVLCTTVEADPVKINFELV